MALTQCAVWRNVLRSCSASALFLLWTLASFFQISHGATLAIEFRDDELPRPSPSDFYVFTFSPPLGNQRKHIVLVAQNYTSPLILPNVAPTTAYNVTVFINELPMPTQTFVSGPDPPVKLEAKSTGPNETIVYWKPPLAGTVDKYRIQLFSRDQSGNITEGQPLDWDAPKITIAPLYPGGEYSVEVRSLVSSYDRGIALSEPVRTSFVQPPATPTKFRRIPSAISETSVSVQWDAAEGVVDAYFVSIQASIQPNDSFVNPKDPLKATFSKLSPGTVYTLAVVSVHGNASSSPSFLNVTTRPLSPTKLRDISASPEPRSLHIGWDPPVAPKTGVFYRVTVNGTELNLDNPVDSRATVDNLLPDETYMIVVESFIKNTDDLPLYSKGVQGIFHTVSDASVSVTAVIDRPEIVMETADGSVKFLEANATSEDNSVVNGDVSTGQHVNFRDLVGGTHYLIYARLLQNGLNVVRSFEKLTYPFPPIDISTNKSLTTTDSIMLEWSKPFNTRFQGYQILYQRDDAGAITPPPDPKIITVANASITSFNVTGLETGTKYSFRLKSFVEDVFSVETPAALYCTRPLKPSSIVQPLPVKLMLQLQRPSNTTKYYRVKLLNLDVKDMPVREITIRNDSMVVNYSIAIDYLGATYEVRVAAVSCDLLSEEVSHIVNSLPPTVIFTRPPTEVTQTSIKFLFQAGWKLKRSIFTRFVIATDGIPPKYVLPNDEDMHVVEFTGLIPGTNYKILGWSERGEVQSDKRYLMVQLKPNNVTVLNATKISSRSIDFTWETPVGVIGNYEIGYNNTAPVSTNETSWSFTGLLPFTVYSIYVVARSGTERSGSLTRFFTTLEDKPGPVKSFQLTPQRSSVLTLKWSAPESPNGIITGYVLEYKENSTGEQWIRLDLAPSKDLSHSLSLNAGKTYLFRIAPVNSAGIGPAQDGSMTMPIAAPIARRSSRPVKTDVSKDTITLDFSKEFFMDTNGEVVKYAVIVAEDRLQNSNRTLAWRDVQNMAIWPPYEATPLFNPFNDLNDSYAVVINPENGQARVTIGTERDCSNSPEVYCNGPLKENTKYYVKLRAFTSLAENNLLYADTEYSEPIMTEASRSSALAIAIGVCVPVIVLVFFAALLVLMRKYNLGPFVKRARKAVVKTADDKISITESLPEKSRPVKLREFAEHVRMMSADSDFRFSEEYEDLKHVGRDQSCAAADLPVNRAKNRFTNILPYDHSRVKLLETDDEEGTDYINANYMPGYNSPREFIVTQGPLPGTRDDFWRMVWEQNCRAIVMLTRCVEKGREKCDHYWPYDTDPIIYGDVEVTIMNESQTPDWTMREFRVAKNNEPARSVRHIHFTAWPDFGVPERPQTLIKFVRAFRERVPTDSRPVIAHCSAGVGRSGTFIALDRLLQQIRTQDVVDIFGMVVEMRKERVWMVQTEQQYICIHHCLLCVLEHREDDASTVSSAMHENPCYDEAAEIHL
ncbi:tyrosine-protein phosphatase 10D-like isoform X2 [Paramacrobiotus metropolitanus]|uniref:tyrosine-protein phosphatase 10D-like isoform X2 n=1 Tax=Paramacrobiotus metropolitanus TaxID=2943436 RepID=UPI0024456EBF|nr:tyrosine-protein phosphatase 10D-like isoform X2 [Paramacrobiotus metropolitanus]